MIAEGYRVSGAREGIGRFLGTLTIRSLLFRGGSRKNIRGALAIDNVLQTNEACLKNEILIVDDIK